MSKWYVFSEKGSYLRQRALYSDDCNRLQQTATDYNRKKAHLCVKEPCIPMTATDCNRLQQTAFDCSRLQQTATDCNRLQQKEGSSLRQRALYSDDCNRLQQTATDYNRKKAHLCVKEPCIPMTATDCNRLQQTATERRLIFASKSLVFR